MKKFFFDTMSDITIWAQHCQKTTGINGIEEYKWSEKSLDLQLFRLGRLQFEPMALPKEIILNGKKIDTGTIVYNVHIAAGEKLDYDQVQASYRQAMYFFRGISDIFICDSWL